MKRLPKISIVTPSLNQGAYLAETLQSLVDQRYSNLEVIIQDGGSSDGSTGIANQFIRDHPGIFQLFQEEDHGQADAINRGFRRSTGTIMGFLNSDDLLEKGCLHRVSEEIDPNRGRCIVFGRCAFFGGESIESGSEHPSKYESHFDQLAIWKRRYNQIPQPSTFWHRQVWDACGGLDPAIAHAIDYDLFCRISSRYRFHKVPEIWSHYRIHDESKTAKKGLDELMEECFEISRRHWGPWHSILRWRCQCSYGLYSRSRRPKAISVLRQAEQALIERRFLAATLRGVHALWHAPIGAPARLLAPLAATLGWRRLAKRCSPATENLCPNRWIGPFFETRLDRKPGQDRLHVVVEVPERLLNSAPKFRLFIGSRAFSDWESESNRNWISAQIPLDTSDKIAVTILCDRYFIPALSGESEDNRLLSARLLVLEASNGQVLE